MPRYFFNVHNGLDPPYQDPPEEEGLLFDSPKEARSQAVIAAGEMLRDLDGKFWSGDDWTMTVTDEQGATVCTLRLSGTANAR